ncbi:MAG: ATP-binding protein [Chloroflexota bacterium]
MIVSHASADPRFMDHPGLKLYGIESYIAVPLNRRDGTYFGTLCALDPLPAELNEEGLAIFELLASLIAFELEAEDSERRSRAVAEQMAAQARELVRLEERERIAMDLHDGVIQSLYSIVLSLGAQELNQEPNQPDQELTQTIARLNDVIHEIRNNIFSLNVRDLGEAGLRSGIQRLADELRVGTLVKARVAVDSGIEDGIDTDALRSLLYIAREATSNVIRHAGATSVTISVKRAGEHLVMSIRDNGRGFDVSAAGAQRGNGLRNIAERARLIGGAASIESQPGRGTQVCIRLGLMALHGASP